MSLHDGRPKKAPANTAAEAKTRDGALRFLAESSRVDNPSDAILNQEASGQREFVGSDTLPADGGMAGTERVRAVLEAAGVVFGEPVPGDPLFVYVELPPGWRKQGTDHAMWSKLLDDHGRERASIFYKAAFYDRNAHIGLRSRFSAGTDYDRLERENVYVYRVTDAGTVIHETEAEACPEDAQDWQGRSDAEKRARAKAEAWLAERWPDWQNPAAYWDAEAQS